VTTRRLLIHAQGSRRLRWLVVIVLPGSHQPARASLSPLTPKTTNTHSKPKPNQNHNPTPTPPPQPARYSSMTGLKQLGALRFADELAHRGIPFWARYVLIPGHTDSARDIELFAEWAKKQPTIAGVELLPYHLYGKNKWEALGLRYPLEGVRTPPREEVARVIGRLEGAGLKVLCEASGAAAPLSSAHTGAHS